MSELVGWDPVESWEQIGEIGVDVVSNRGRTTQLVAGRVQK